MDMSHIDGAGRGTGQGAQPGQPAQRGQLGQAGRKPASRAYGPVAFFSDMKGPAFAVVSGRSVAWMG